MREFQLPTRPRLRQAIFAQRTALAIARPRTEEESPPGDSQGTQKLSARTLHDVAPGVVAEPAQWNSPPRGVSARRNHRVDAATLQPAMDPGVGISGIRRHRRDHVTRNLNNLIHLGFNHLLLAHCSPRHSYVEHNPSRVVHLRVLLVTRFELPMTR